MNWSFEFSRRQRLYAIVFNYIYTDKKYSECSASERQLVDLSEMERSVLETKRISWQSVRSKLAKIYVNLFSLWVLLHEWEF